MDFDLPADLEEYRKQVREFSLREFTEETAMMHDIKEKYPDELRKKEVRLLELFLVPRNPMQP